MNQFKKDIESTIQRYLRNELSSDEVEQFEDYFVDKPMILEKIEMSQKMMVGLNSADEADLSAAIKPPKRSDVRRSGMSIRRYFAWLTIPTPAYVSALVCLGTALLVSFSQISVPNHPDLIGFSTAQTRNAGDSIMIDLNSEGSYRAVFIKLPKVEYRRYRLHVIEPDSDELVWKSEPFSFSALRDRMIFLPDELALPRAKLELLGERPDQTTVPVRFCHYSEVCD